MLERLRLRCRWQGLCQHGSEYVLGAQGGKTERSSGQKPIQKHADNSDRGGWYALRANPAELDGDSGANDGELIAAFLALPFRLGVSSA